MTKDETAVFIVGVIFLSFLMVVYGWLLIVRRRYHNKGNTMTPTPKLRFFEHVLPAPEYGENIGKTVRYLQQWWEGEKGGEWLDVPIEKEEVK